MTELELQADDLSQFVSDDGLPVFRGEGWEEHTSAWSILQHQDNLIQIGRGAIAASLDTKYGEKSLEKFAGEVRVAHSTLKGYRAVYRRLERLGKVPRGTILNAVADGDLRYGHVKVAAGVEDDKTFVKLLTKAQDESWSYRELEGEVRKAEPRWTSEERDLQKKLKAGETVVVNRDHHRSLIKWAKAEGLYVNIMRPGKWGNPAVLYETYCEEDRKRVVRHYWDEHLPNHPELVEQVGELKGKALMCVCTPWLCHGDVLRALAEGEDPSELDLRPIGNRHGYDAFRSKEEVAARRQSDSIWRMARHLEDATPEQVAEYLRSNRRYADVPDLETVNEVADWLNDVSYHLEQLLKQGGEEEQA